ncbi:recombinase family protein [Patescibacteria group bacterium]
MKALIYTRVSTEEQANDSHHSLDAQKNICTKTCNDLKYKIVGTYKDAGKTATNMKRDGLKDLLIKCEEDPSINVVVVQDTDRIARNTKDHLTIKALLQKADVKLVSASQPSIDDSAEGNMIDTIIASVNQFQSDLTSRKTTKGLEEKVRKGGWPLEAPLGYKNVTDSKGNKTVLIDKKVAHLITEAFKLYSSGNYSVNKLIEILHKKGLRSKRGKQIRNNKMNWVLKNRFYIGEVNWKGIKTNGLHKPIVSEKVFEAVQQVIAEHNHKASRKRKYDYLLSGYLYCTECGSRLTGETHPNKNASYYRCVNKVGHADKFSRIENIESQVENKFKTIQFPEEFINLVIDKVKLLFDEKKKDIERKKRELINQRTQIERKRNVAEEKLFSGLISDEDFERNRDKFKEEIEDIQDQINDLDRVRELKINLISEVLKLTRDIYSAYKNAPTELKRKYLNLFWERFDIGDRKIFKATPSKLFEAVRKDYKASIKTQIPTQYEPRISHQPNRISSKVQTRSDWGG